MILLTQHDRCTKRATEGSIQNTISSAFFAPCRHVDTLANQAAAHRDGVLLHILGNLWLQKSGSSRVHSPGSGEVTFQLLKSMAQDLQSRVEGDRLGECVSVDGVMR